MGEGALEQQAASWAGVAAQPLTGRPPPPPLQDGSQAAAGGKNVLRLFASSLPWQTLGKRKNALKLSWCWTRKHMVQVRLGACTRMCVPARVGACGHVWARVCSCARLAHAHNCL